LLSLTTIEGLQIGVVTHPTLNPCKGVVNYDDSSSESEKDLKAFFEERGVVYIHQIQKGVDGRLIPTSTLVLAFNCLSLPVPSI
jgi:hypothetical protein